MGDSTGLVIGALTLLVTACGGSTDDNGGAGTPSPTSTSDFAGDGFGDKDSAPCWLKLSTSGALTRTFTSNGCGSGGDLLFWDFISNILADGGPGDSVGMKLPDVLAAGATGPIALEGLIISTDPDRSVDDDESTWESAPGDCTIDVVANQASEDSLFGTRYDVRLRGSCSAPLAPDATTRATGELTVSPFLATGFIVP